MPEYPENEFGEQLYASGETPAAGDMIEFGAQGGRMLVSRVVDNKLCVGAAHFSPHLAVLLSRHPSWNHDDQPARKTDASQPASRDSAPPEGVSRPGEPSREAKHG